MKEARQKEHFPVTFETQSASIKTPHAVAPNAAHVGAGHSLSQISINAPQPSLGVSTPGDASEQQADALAAEVMRMDVPDSPSALPNMSPLLPAGRDAGPALQRKETGGTTQTRTGGGLSGNGTPLDPATRAFMEPRFGHDFSHVRVHTGSAAAHSADTLAARAFTVGSDIAFRVGEYAPGTGAGRELLAHELTHVVQQKSGPASIQRKPVANHLGRGLDVQSSDIADFTRNASVFLYDVLNRSQDITAQEKAKLGIGPDKVGSAESDANLKQVQSMSGVLYGLERRVDTEERRVMAQDAQDDPYVGGDVRGPMAASGAGRAMHHQKEALDNDTQVQKCRQELLAQKQEFGQTHPILLSAKQDYKAMSEGSTQSVQASASARIHEVEQGILQTKAMVKGGELDIWALPELLKQAMDGVGVSQDTPLGKAILAKAASDKNWKTGRDVFLTALGIGLGLASLAVLFGGTMVAGTLGVGGMMTLTGTSLALNTYNAYESVSNFDKNKAQANTSLDHGSSFRHEEPSRFEEVTSVAFALLDLHGLGSEYAGLRATTRRIEEIGAKGPAYIAEHKGAAIAELRQEAQTEFAALSQKGKIPKGMTEENFVRRVAEKAEESLAREAETRLARARELRRARAEEQRLGPEAKGVPAGEGEALEIQAGRKTHDSAPKPFIPPSIEGPKAQVLDTGRRNAEGVLEVGGHGESVPTMTVEEARAKHRAFEERAAARQQAKAASAEPVVAPAAEPTPLAMDASPSAVDPETVSTAVTPASAPKPRPGNEAFEAEYHYTEGDGWRDGEGKRVYPKTVNASPKPAEGSVTPSDPSAPDSTPLAADVADTAAAPVKRSRRTLRGSNDDGEVVYTSEADQSGWLGKTPPAPPAKTLASVESVTGGGGPVGPEPPALASGGGGTPPTPLADLSEIDTARARINELREQRTFDVEYSDDWYGSKTQVKKASRGVRALDGERIKAGERLKTLEADANLPEAADMKARLTVGRADPVALINENQSWARLGELNLGKDADARLLAARDAVVMQLKTDVEQQYHVFIHAGDGNRVIDKVKAGKVSTDVDLVVSSRAESDAGKLAEMGEGDQTSRLADARRDLQDRLNQTFGGDSNRVAMVNVFMADKRLPLQSAALKAQQDSEGLVEGLRGLREADPSAYKAQKAVLSKGAEKGDPRLDLLQSAEIADDARITAINTELQTQGINPAQATPAERAASQEQVRQRMEQAAEAALHRYEAARQTATPDELDALAVEYNRAVQQSAVYTPEAYTPHGALELPLSKRETAIGTTKNDLSKPMVRDEKTGNLVPAKEVLTGPVAAQATLGETRMFLDVLENIPTPVNQAAHCAKYLGRHLNQFLQVIDLEKYPMISRLGGSLDRFQAEMVAVKDVGDENAKVRRLFDVLGDDHRNPTAVAQEFVEQSKRMMYDLNARLIDEVLGIPQKLPPPGLP